MLQFAGRDFRAALGVSILTRRLGRMLPLRLHRGEYLDEMFQSSPGG